MPDYSFRYRDRRQKDPITGKAKVAPLQPLRKRIELLETMFVDLVKKHYINEYLRTTSEPSLEGLDEYIKSIYTERQETAVMEYKGPVKKRFFVVEGYGNFYMVEFEYRDGELVYDAPYSGAVFETIWNDIDLAIAFARQHIGGISREQAKIFKEYLIEDANDYPNSDQLKEEIKKLFLPYAVEELKEQVAKDLLEEIERKPASAKAVNALERYIEQKTSAYVYGGIVPYQEPKLAVLQPRAEQYGLKMWTALYEYAELPEKIAERIRYFLMSNFWEVFVKLTPYNISHSKKLEEDIAAGNRDAIAFKEVMLRGVKHLA